MLYRVKCPFCNHNLRVVYAALNQEEKISLWNELRHDPEMDFDRDWCFDLWANGIVRNVGSILNTAFLSVPDDIPDVKFHRYTVYTEPELAKVIEAVEGVYEVHTGRFNGMYQVYVDPRYDQESVLNTIHREVVRHTR